MPQVKEPLIKRLIKEALKEDVTVGPENTNFSIKLIPSNPQSETKQGLRLQLTPKEGYLDPEMKNELSKLSQTADSDFEQTIHMLNGKKHVYINGSYYRIQ